MEWNTSTKIVAVFFVALVMQSFCVFPVQADDQTTAHDRSYWNDLEIESLVEYPDGWFFTLDQMKALYEVEYNEGKRLTNFVRHNEGKYLTQCNGEPFGIPERFILTTLQHLQEMLLRTRQHDVFHHANLGHVGQHPDGEGSPSKVAW